MNNIDMLILFLITFCASTFFTYYVKRILIKARIADNPIVSEHRHKSGTPTMGGIAFLFTLSFIISLYYQDTREKGGVNMTGKYLTINEVSKKAKVTMTAVISGV